MVDRRARPARILLSFITYGSVSHDLVHRTLRLPQWLNEVAALRDRADHVPQRARLSLHAPAPSRALPADDDVEAAAARMSAAARAVRRPRAAAAPVVYASATRRTIADGSSGEGMAVIALIAASVLWLPVGGLRRADDRRHAGSFRSSRYHPARCEGRRPS